MQDAQTLGQHAACRVFAGAEVDKAQSRRMLRRDVGQRWRREADEGALGVATTTAEHCEVFDPVLRASTVRDERCEMETSQRGVGRTPNLEQAKFVVPSRRALGVKRRYAVERAVVFDVDPYRGHRFASGESSLGRRASSKVSWMRWGPGACRRRTCRRRSCGPVDTGPRASEG